MELDSQEQVVDEMIAEGKKIVAEAMTYIIRDLGKTVAGMVVGYSGGGDSIVVTHFANDNFPDMCTFNADTCVGLKPVRDHIDNVIKANPKWTPRILKAHAEGPPKRTPTNDSLLANWRDGETSYEEIVLNHGFAGPAMHGRMYQRLKERPLHRLRQEMCKRGQRIIVMSGVRHDESAIRAGYKRAWQDVPKTGMTWVNPFYFRSAADFAMYRDEFSLLTSPVKRIVGISGECCCGTFGSRDERNLYRKVDHNFADYLDRLEQRVRERFPWDWGEGPPTWWMQKQAGQKFLFELDPREADQFQPMCTGCNNGRR